MNNTKNIVMSRVRAIHFMRPFVSVGALCAVLVLVSIYAVSREVWVEMVFRNMPSPADFAIFVNFFAVAFLKTSFLVQAFSVVALASALALLRESFRLLSFVPSRA